MQYYLLQLARSLKRPYFEVAAWPAEEILLQLAYDRTQSAEFQAALQAERERKQQAGMTPVQRAQQWEQVFGSDAP